MGSIFKLRNSERQQMTSGMSERQKTTFFGMPHTRHIRSNCTGVSWIEPEASKRVDKKLQDLKHGKVKENDLKIICFCQWNIQVFLCNFGKIRTLDPNIIIEDKVYPVSSRVCADWLNKCSERSRLKFKDNYSQS